MEASLIGPDGQRTNLTSNALTIGRAPDNQMVLQDQQASSHHAEVRPDAQGYLVVDVNSRNGTFVNEQRLAPQTPRLLISGDVIRIGETRLNYQTAGVDDEATMRASTADYGSPGYSPTVAVPPPSATPGYGQPAQSDYVNYQQPAPAAPSFQQPAQPDFMNYQQQTPSAPNYPQMNQPGYNQAPPAYPTPVAPWPGAPGQFGAPAAPAAERPRRSRTGLIVGIIVALLLVGGGIGGFLYINRSTPEKTLQAYCTALQNSDAQGAFNLLSARSQSQTSVAKLNQGFQLIKSPLVGGIKSCTFTNVQENGSTATADVTVTLGNTAIPVKPAKAILVNENGSWKIDSSAQPAPTQ